MLFATDSLKKTRQELWNQVKAGRITNQEMFQRALELDEFDALALQSLAAEHLEAGILNLSVDADRMIRFTKQYNGMGNVGHKIEYEGTISANGMSIIGKWTGTAMWSGTFEIAKET